MWSSEHGSEAGASEGQPLAKSSLQADFVDSVWNAALQVDLHMIVQAASCAMTVEPMEWL